MDIFFGIIIVCRKNISYFKKGFIMPMIKVQTTESISLDKKEKLLPILSKAIAEGIEKPEQYVLVIIEDKISMMMSGSIASTAFVEIRSIAGLNRSVNNKLSQKICSILQDHLKIAGERVFINFIEFAGSNWGWNGSVIG